MHDFANFGLTEDEGRKLDILQKKLIILRDGEKVRIDGEIQDAKNKFTKSEKAHKEKINKIEAQQGVTKKKINEERVAANKEYRAKKHKKNKEDKIRELKVRKKSLSNGTDSCQNNVCLPYNYHQNGIHRLGTESNKQYINTLYERLKNADTAKKIKGKLNDIRQEMYTGRFKVNDIRIIPGPQQL